MPNHGHTVAVFTGSTFPDGIAATNFAGLGSEGGKLGKQYPALWQLVSTGNRAN